MSKKNDNLNASLNKYINTAFTNILTAEKDWLHKFDKNNYNNKEWFDKTWQDMTYLT